MRSIITVALALAILGFSSLTSSAQITMNQVTIGSAGGTLQNGAMTMELTVGQPVIGSTQGGSLNNDVGFWWQIYTVTVGVDNAPLPTSFAYHGAAPNPFSTRTSVTF